MSEELRKAELRKACLDAHVERVRKFLRTYGCHLANHADITNEIRGMMNNRGEDWPWVEKWATEDALAWVNDLQTIVFQAPLSNLTGEEVPGLHARSVEFSTQCFRISNAGWSHICPHALG
jgi:hypothetical protein